MTLPEVIKAAKKSGQRFKQKPAKTLTYDIHSSGLIRYRYIGGKNQEPFYGFAEFTANQITATNWILIDKEKT